jgi:hypothetical protein
MSLWIVMVASRADKRPTQKNPVDSMRQVSLFVTPVAVRTCGFTRKSALPLRKKSFEINAMPALQQLAQDLRMEQHPQGNGLSNF